MGWAWRGSKPIPTDGRGRSPSISATRREPRRRLRDLKTGDTMLMVAGAPTKSARSSATFVCSWATLQPAPNWRAQISVGRRFSAVRIQRRGEAAVRGQSSVHRAESRGSRAARFRAAQGARARLRYGAQRRGDGRRLDSYPQPRAAVEGVRAARPHARGGARQLRLSDRGADLWRAAARRDRFWRGPL